MTSGIYYNEYCHSDYYLRKLQETLGSQGAKFPVFREFTLTVRMGVDRFFDQLALMKNIAGTRIGMHDFVWSHKFTVGQAAVIENGQFTQCTFRVWADSMETVRATEAALMENVATCRVKEAMFILDWHFASKGNDIANTPIEELATDLLLDIAYLGLGASPAEFVGRFLESDAAVLVLQGPPGTGKTRLIRYIMGEMSRRVGKKAKAMYTSDGDLLRDDRLFVRFLTDQYDAFVVEDADHLLSSRAHGNVDLHRFLNIADGVIRAKTRKLIFSTNLPNMRDIDDAIVRPGRCFAHVELGLLGKEQATNCLGELGLHGDQLAAFSAAFSDKKSVSLASLYAFAEHARKSGIPSQLKAA